jgi:hypothetical protein
MSPSAILSGMTNSQSLAITLKVKCNFQNRIYRNTVFAIEFQFITIIRHIMGHLIRATFRTLNLSTALMGCIFRAGPASLQEKKAIKTKKQSKSWRIIFVKVNG